MSFYRPRKAYNLAQVEAILIEQNAGRPCPFCDSVQGHRSTCEVLNNGKAPTPPELKLTDEDRAFLADLKITIEEVI